MRTAPFEFACIQGETGEMQNANNQGHSAVAMGQVGPVFFLSDTLARGMPIKDLAGFLNRSEEEVRERAISKFREGLDWIYRTYFTGAEQTNLKLRELRPSVDRVTIGLSLVSFLGCLMTLIYMWSVR
jgi:hypothetical protein